MRGRRSWWVAYLACAALVLGALAWVSAEVVRLEAAERRAADELAREQGLRLALWRMDSWLAPLLAREAARPHEEYQAFYPEGQAFDPARGKLDPGAVLALSPLVGFRSDLFRLHFQVDDTGAFSSPQAPTGNDRDLAESSVLAPGVADRNFVLLGGISRLVGAQDLRRRLGVIEARVTDVLANEALPDEESVAVQQIAAQEREPTQAERAGQNRAGYVRRARGTYASKNPQGMAQNDLPAEQEKWLVDPTGASHAQIGSLLPVWLPGTLDGGPGGRELCFVRRVRLGDREVLQGFLADWPRLSAELLAQAGGLFPGATLEPVAEERLADDESGRVLATVPVEMVVPSAEAVAGPTLTPGRIVLGVAWLAVLGAVGAVGLTLRSTIAYADKRSRFASTVTHELRTPLTTFRMYCEMLAEGMVPDEERRQEYLRTLQQESDRLATLVENVLAYARIEDGRAPARRETVSFGALMQRVSPPIERRVEEAGMRLMMQGGTPPQTLVAVDADAVGQVVFNLVDNACKYGRNEARPEVEVATEVAAGALTVSVRDHGPGVPAAIRRDIFEAFDRGGRDARDAVPGVGLGLALSRGIARELGGTLSVANAPGGGALFTLRIPA